MESLRGERSLNRTSTASRLMFVHFPPIPLQLPSPLPLQFAPKLCTSTGKWSLYSLAGCGRDVGPITNAPSKHRCAESSCICPSPFHRDVGSLFLFDNLGREKCQGGTRKCEAHQVHPKNKTTIKVVVCFLSSLLNLPLMTFTV